MSQFVCDPSLKPGESALAAPRRDAGTAYAWEPGGDADAYVAFVGPEHLAVVDGKVYARLMDGSLHPHRHLAETHIVVRSVGGDPRYLTPHEFTTEWAVVAPDTNAGPVVPPAVDAGQVDAGVAGPVPASTEPELKRAPGRPAGAKNKPKDA